MDLICFSHIRWNFVYQRPQHLLNRYALNNRVFIVEEPVIGGTSDFYVIEKSTDTANLWIVVLHISEGNSEEKRNHILKALLDSCMYSNNITDYLLWYYSPMALPYSDHLEPKLIIYDCMDELSAFKAAPPRMKELEVQLLDRADLVFTGGHSLYEAKKHLHKNIHPFPSSIDKSHFVKARLLKEDTPDQASIPHPRFGFYGVIDERFNIELLDKLTTMRPDWHFILVGPIIKINPDSLPVKTNIHYLGKKEYKQLPEYLAGWDAAILPFALNESTKFISPTKTPEYLAGGKPVISTSITDVITPYGKLGLVRIADTAEEFIQAGEELLSDKNNAVHNKKVDDFLAGISWNKTWSEMTKLMDEAMENKLKNKTKKRKVYV